MIVWQRTTLEFEMTESQRVLNFLASAGPFANTTVKNSDADEIMLATGGTIMSRGYLYNIKSKRISPGVCRLTLERTN